jgi:hypothetical protein
MEAFDVKPALDSMLAFVAQNYLLPVWILGIWVAYWLGRRHGARPKPRPPGPPLRPEMIESGPGTEPRACARIAGHETAKARSTRSKPIRRPPAASRSGTVRAQPICTCWPR